MKKQEKIEKLLKLGADPDELKTMTPDELDEELANRTDTSWASENGKDDD